MSEDKIRIGMIGIGFYAITAHVPALRDTGQVEIAAISRRNPKALADAKEALDVEGAYTDWHDLLKRSDLGAIVVSTAHHAHAEPTIAALQQGYPVLVEKTGPAAAAMDYGTTKVVGGVEKLRGINDFNAFRSIEDILKRR